MRQVVTLTVILVAALADLWWWRLARVDPTPIGVVIITLDTTRADRLSPYGFMDVTMPHLDRLAREGVVFDQAMSVAPLTLPAHASVFTGLFPPGHGLRDNSDQALAAEHTTLAEVLQARGYRTGAFVGSVVLGPDRGLAQGFDDYRGVPPGDRPEPVRGQRRANDVMADAIDWLDEIQDSRFFLWTHLYDAHRPYDPPEPYRSAHFDPYIGEIVFADSQIGRLLDALERRQLLDRTVVIVAGDHGESMGEHGERDHGVFVYDSVLRVPLIIRAPGMMPGRAGAVVRLTDVMPTVLDLLQLPAGPVDGVSLKDLLVGVRHTLDLEAYSESRYPERLGWSPLFALRDGRFKLIDAPRPELYDLQRDPFEEHNVYAERRAVAAAMASRLATLRQRAVAWSSPMEATAVPADLQERLRALGYVGRSRAPLDRKRLPDPKDCIGLQHLLPDMSGVVPLGKSVSCRHASTEPRR